MTEKLKHTPEAIGERLRTQNNRATADPVFLVQIEVATVGRMTEYSDRFCYHDHEEGHTYFDTPPEGWDKHGPDEQKGVSKSGYTTRWETVAIALTEAGAQEHIDLNAHNLTWKSDTGKYRIYVDSFYRVPEMQELRKYLMSLAPPPSPGIALQAEGLVVLETQDGRIVVTRARDGRYCVMRQCRDEVKAEMVDSAHDVYEDIWPEAVRIIANLKKGGI